MQTSQPLATTQALSTHNLASTSTVYDNNVYRDQYTTTASGPTDPALASHTAPYPSMTGAPSHPYNLGTAAPTSQQSANTFDQQPYSVSEDSGIPSAHVAALAGASSSQPATDAYAYAHTQTADPTHQPAYSTHGFTPQDWRSWGRTYTQPMSHPGEYLNTATTLMTLGREAAPLDNEPHALMDGSNVGVQVHHGHQWPTILFSGQTNGQMG